MGTSQLSGVHAFTLCFVSSGGRDSAIDDSSSLPNPVWGQSPYEPLVQYVVPPLEVIAIHMFGAWSQPL